MLEQFSQMQGFLTFIIALFGAIFGVYHFFRNPDIKNSEKITTLTLAFDNYQKLVEQKFSSHITLSDKLSEMEKNHLHTIEENVKENRRETNHLATEIASLRAIINERIPAKQ